MTPLVVGNWKMHGTQTAASKLASEVARGARRSRRVEVAIAPPYTALAAVQRVLRRSPIRLAAQNCHWQEQGAFTGEVSAPMLRELGCTFVIIGHSERRRIFHETDSMIADKIRAALKAELRPILCVGETLRERRAGLTMRVIARQLRVALKGLDKNDIEKTEIAYEPVWAIGTGRNATPEQASEVHERIRGFLVRSFGDAIADQVRILYGGSVKPENAAELAAGREIHGFLVGGASLDPDAFVSIVRRFNESA